MIDGATARTLAPPADLIVWMREAMQLVSARDVELPLRRGMALPDGAGAIGMMPGFVGGEIHSAGVKLVSLVPPERRMGSSHLGLMVLYDADGLVPQAILCGATVTAIRTSAVTAVATDALARENARVLAVLGTGEQAEAHVAALRQVRPFDDIRLWDRDVSSPRAIRLAEQTGARLHARFEDAIAGADVICTTTSAREPILPGALLEPGMHVNLVGSSAADAREADDEVVARSRFFIDYRPSTMDQAGELLHAIAAGRVTEDHIVGEIGEVLAGSSVGRTSAEDITLYKSLGVAAQDIVTARHIFHLAEQKGLGMVATL
jgi:ornithine cyclodeaminase